MNPTPDRNTTVSNWMLAGLFLGTLFGVFLENIAVCAGIGMLLGILLGAIQSRRTDQER